MNTPLGRDDSETISPNSKALLEVMQFGSLPIVFTVTNVGLLVGVDEEEGF
jgi:hypothetical protein